MPSPNWITYLPSISVSKKYTNDVGLTSVISLALVYVSTFDALL